MDIACKIEIFSDIRETWTMYNTKFKIGDTVILIM